MRVSFGIFRALKGRQGFILILKALMFTQGGFNQQCFLMLKNRAASLGLDFCLLLWIKRSRDKEQQRRKNTDEEQQ